MPAMQVKWGSYAFTAGACKFAVRQSAVLNAADVPYMYEIETDVSGRLYGNGDVALSNAEAGLRANLAIPFQDFGVLRNDGQKSGTWFPNANTIGGNVVTRGPNFGGTTAAEYALYREFDFTVRTRLPIYNAANAIIEFSETVEYEGGEPEYVLKRAINGPPQKQLVWFQTEYRVTQSGRAVGFSAYPNPGRMLFPSERITAPKITRENPKRLGNRYVNYPINWTYVFASASPLVALPNVWVS